MDKQALNLKMNVRVWQDERFGHFWRVAYADGDGETIVSFPDTAALGDFIAERMGLELIDALKEQPLHQTSKMRSVG